MIGEILALLAAICWAFSAALYKRVLRNISYLTANLVRSAFAVPFLLCVFLTASHQFPKVPLNALSLLFLAAITNLAIGDSLFFISLKKVGLSRTQPISSSYPLYSIILAAIFLGERITVTTIIGTPLIVIGIAVVSITRNEKNNISPRGVPVFIGTPFALGSAFCYSIGFIAYKFAIINGSIDPIFASLVRWAAVLPLLIIAFGIKKPDVLRSLTKREVAALAVGGILELGIGGTLLFESLKLGNASTTIPLSSTTPLFALVLATQYAGEKMLKRLLIGTVITVAGIVLVASSAML